MNQATEAREFQVGDRVKIDPVWGRSYTQPWKRFAHTGRLATVTAVHFPQDNAPAGTPLFSSPSRGFVIITFDGRFKTPERGQIEAKHLILVEPAAEATNG